MAANEPERHNKLFKLFTELTRGAHLDADVLQAYALKQIDDPLKMVQIEEHLAKCYECSHFVKLFRTPLAPEPQFSVATEEAVTIAEASRRALARLPLIRLVAARTDLILAVAKLVLPSDVHSVLPTLVKVLQRAPRSVESTPPGATDALPVAAFGPDFPASVSDTSKQLLEVAAFVHAVEMHLVDQCASMPEVLHHLGDAVSDAKVRLGVRWPQPLCAQIVAEYRRVLGERIDSDKP